MPVSTGIGEHLWQVYHSGIFQVTQAHSAWLSLLESVQWVLAMVSATALEEMASYA